MLLLDTEGDANHNALASFSLALADVVIVRSATLCLDARGTPAYPPARAHVYAPARSARTRASQRPRPPRASTVFFRGGAARVRQVHPPCASPTAGALRDTYESLFATVRRPS